MFALVHDDSWSWLRTHHVSTHYGSVKPRLFGDATSNNNRGNYVDAMTKLGFIVRELLLLKLEAYETDEKYELALELIDAQRDKKNRELVLKYYQLDNIEKEMRLLSDLRNKYAHELDLGMVKYKKVHLKDQSANSLIDRDFSKVWMALTNTYRDNQQVVIDWLCEEIETAKVK